MEIVVLKSWRGKALPLSDFSHGSHPKTVTVRGYHGMIGEATAEHNSRHKPLLDMGLPVYGVFYCVTVYHMK